MGSWKKYLFDCLEDYRHHRCLMIWQVSLSELTKVIQIYWPFGLNLRLKRNFWMRLSPVWWKHCVTNLVLKLRDVLDLQVRGVSTFWNLRYHWIIPYFDSWQTFEMIWNLRSHYFCFLHAKTNHQSLCSEWNTIHYWLVPRQLVFGRSFAFIDSLRS